MTWPWILLFMLACTALMTIYIYFIEIRRPIADDVSAAGTATEVRHDDERVAA